MTLRQIPGSQTLTQEYSVECRTLYSVQRRKASWRPLDSPDEAVAGELQTGVGEDSLRPGEEGGVKADKNYPVGAFYHP